MESLGTICRTRSHEVGHFSLAKMLFLLSSAFAHTLMKAGGAIYDSGDVSVTTARSARSKN